MPIDYAPEVSYRGERWRITHVEARGGRRDERYAIAVMIPCEERPAGPYCEKWPHKGLDIPAASCTHARVDIPEGWVAGPRVPLPEDLPTLPARRRSWLGRAVCSIGSKTSRRTS